VGHKKDFKMNGIHVVTVVVWILPTSLFNVSALPCESQNTENFVLRWDITEENCLYHSFIQVDQGHHNMS